MTNPAPSPPDRPYWRLVADPIVVLATLAALGWLLIAGDRPQPGCKPQVAAPPAAPAPDPEPPPEAPPSPPTAPIVDREAVARAESALDAASRDRARADARADEAARRLGAAELDAARVASSLRTLGSRIRDPSSRIASTRARGALLRSETQRLKRELASLADAPRPRRKPLIDRTPVAQVIDGTEFHFELHRSRVAFIDLDRLMAEVKSDARIQIRLMATGSPNSRPVVSRVGPVGDFAIRYELGRSMPTVIEDMLNSRGTISVGLLGWEIVPEREVRGETFEALRHPASDFARVLNTLDPRTATITLWVYPDSFGLYRQLRDFLHARGFVVAARPLPEGMAIRGSPSGSVSAGQ